MYIKTNAIPIYLKNNNLYLINESNKSIRLSSNVYKYSYIKDNSGYIHICCIDFKNKLTYITYKNKSINKKFICTCNVQGIEYIEFNLFNDLLNIFVVKSNKIKSFDILHIKYNMMCNTYDKFTLNNLLFNKLSCYVTCKKHNLIVLKLQYINNEFNTENKFFFDINNNSWSSLDNVFLPSNLFNYHKSLKYK